MTPQLLRSRGARKFFKSKLATASLLVVGLYLLLAFLIMTVDLISKNECLERVGPDTTPGRGEQVFEKRLKDSEFHLKRTERALGKSKEKIASAVADLALAERRIVDLSPEEVTELVNHGWEIYDEITELKDESGFEAFDAKKAELKAAGVEDKTEIQEQATAAHDLAVAELMDSEAFKQRVADLDTAVAALYAPIGGSDALYNRIRLSLGTDRQGRSIAMRGLFSIKVALQIGVVTALFAVIFGSLLGAAAAFYGSWVDHLVVWLYSTLSSIPSLVLLIVIASAFVGSSYEGTLIPVYCAFGLTYWIGPCRIVRGEVLKIKELEYVQAATSIGFSKFYILLKHVVPNTTHLMFINFSLLFIGAVKSEVILSFLGLGVKSQPSWGIMISDARPEVMNAFFWQIGTATFFMFVLVMAFNILSDALQDAFDPKHVS